MKSEKETIYDYAAELKLLAFKEGTGMHPFIGS